MERKKARMIPPTQIPRHKPTMNSVGSNDRGATLILSWFITSMTATVWDVNNAAAKKVTKEIRNDPKRRKMLHATRRART